MWAYSAKNRQNWYFWYKFVEKGCIPLSDFYHIWLGEGSPRSAPSDQISPLWLTKCGLTAPKIMKMVIFGINLPLRENYGGPQIKLNIGAQLPTFLYAVAPQHCFIAFPLSQTSSFQSVTNKKYHTFWSTLQLARDPRSLPYPSMVGIVGRVIVVIEEVRTIFDPPPPYVFCSDQ